MALITDLTGYIQTGDLFCLIDGRLVIGEAKEGSKNLHILEILKEIQEEGKSAEAFPFPAVVSLPSPIFY